MCQPPLGARAVLPRSAVVRKEPATYWHCGCASRALTAPGRSACYAIAPARPSPWSGSTSSPMTSSSIASSGTSPTGAPSCGEPPLELLERLAEIIHPPPRLHRHRYHGVLAPDALQSSRSNAQIPSPSWRPCSDLAHASPSPTNPTTAFRQRIWLDG